MKRHNGRLLMGASAIAMAIPGIGFAQAAAADPGGTALEEIVVTAQLRSENLQKVPISIVALSGDALARSGVTSTQDLAILLPSLKLTNPTPSRPTFSIRGVSSTDYSALSLIHI